LASTISRDTIPTEIYNRRGNEIVGYLLLYEKHTGHGVGTAGTGSFANSMTLLLELFATTISQVKMEASFSNFTRAQVRK